MRTYENKDELKNEINKSFAKYISEFNDIPEHLKDKRIDEIDRTPAENLAYQVGWTTLVIKWESDERKGIPVKTPSDNFKWNQLGELYQWFTDTYAQLSLQELKDRLNENINSIYAMIDSLSDEELFETRKSAVETEIQELQKTLSLLKFKCWYYETAMKDGNEDAINAMLPDKLPKNIQKLYDKGHE